MINFLNRNAEKFSTESTNYKPFIIIAGPRTGSSYLSSLLRSHPDIISYSELFHPQRVVLGPQHKLVAKEELLAYRQTNPVEFIEAIYNSEYSSNISAVGFKLLYGQARHPSEKALWNWLDQHTEIRILHIIRNNLLAQVVSHRQAQIRRQWTATRQLEDGPLRISLAADRCKSNFQRTEFIRARTESRFQSHSYLKIAYEDLVKENTTVIDRTLDFLGVPSRPLTSELVRMNPWSPEECITNFNELNITFQNTQWAEFFRH